MSSLDDLSRSIFPQILLIIFLTLLNAFFASAEMAFVSVNKIKIKSLSDNGNKSAFLLNKLLDNPSNFLSTIQIGITLAGFFSSASAATTLSIRLLKAISPLSLPYAQEISIIVITVLLSFFTLVFGELVPKRIALNKCESIALFSSKPIYYLSIITKPIIKLLTLSTKLILKLTGNINIEHDNNISTEEIKLLINQSEKNGTINNLEKQMIDKVMDFSDKISKEIMTSRPDTIMIDINDDLNIKLSTLLESKYSRIPVYENNIDNIIGILYIKDLIHLLVDNSFENINFKTILHSPCFVPETKKIDELFLLLKQSKNHMSLLIDEYGGFSGIVTMEDIIEEVMGDIEDEYDKDNFKIKDMGDNMFIIKGNMSIIDFNDKFNTDIKSDDFDTVNGLIISTLNKIPDENDNISLIIENYKLDILEVEDNRIEKVMVSLIQSKVS